VLICDRKTRKKTTPSFSCSFPLSHPHFSVFLLNRLTSCKWRSRRVKAAKCARKAFYQEINFNKTSSGLAAYFWGISLRGFAFIRMQLIEIAHIYLSVIVGHKSYARLVEQVTSIVRMLISSSLVNFLVKCFGNRFGCFALVVLRHLNVDTCSQNPRRVMKAQHGSERWPMFLAHGWPNYDPLAAFGPPTSLIQPAKYLAHFIQAPRSNWTAVQQHWLLPVSWLVCRSSSYIVAASSVWKV